MLGACAATPNKYAPIGELHDESLVSACQDPSERQPSADQNADAIGQTSAVSPK
jgi:hypothetical protein